MWIREGLFHRTSKIACRLETCETKLVNTARYSVVQPWGEPMKNHYPASEDRILDNLQPNPNKSLLHATIRTGDGSNSLAQLVELPYSDTLPFHFLGSYPIFFFQFPSRLSEPVGRCPKKRNCRDRVQCTQAEYGGKEWSHSKT